MEEEKAARKYILLIRITNQETTERLISMIPYLIKIQVQPCKKNSLLLISWFSNWNLFFFLLLDLRIFTDNKERKQHRRLPCIADTKREGFAVNNQSFCHLSSQEQHNHDGYVGPALGNLGSCACLVLRGRSRSSRCSLKGASQAAGSASVLHHHLALTAWRIFCRAAHNTGNLINMTLENITV